MQIFLLNIVLFWVFSITLGQFQCMRAFACICFRSSFAGLVTNMNELLQYNIVAIGSDSNTVFIGFLYLSILNTG